MIHAAVLHGIGELPREDEAIPRWETTRDDDAAATRSRRLCSWLALALAFLR
jgi:hypothetical protein